MKSTFLNTKPSKLSLKMDSEKGKKYTLNFHKVLRNKILDRDGHECQNPDCEGKYKKLDIHHVNYDKKDYKEKNLITLCVPCHMKSNANRKYWNAFYNRIIEKKYNN